MTTEAQAHQQRRVSAAARVTRDSSTTAPLFSLTKRDGVQSLGVFVTAALLLLIADILLLWLHPGTYRVEIGNFRDKFFLTNVNDRQMADGKTYRWSREKSTIWLTQIGHAKDTWLTLELGGRPQPADVQVMINDRPLTHLKATTSPRLYSFVLPPELPEQLKLDIISPTFKFPGDARNLGVKIEGFTLTVPRNTPQLPTAAQYLAQLVLVLTVQLTTLRLGWKWRRQALTLFLVVLALALVLSNFLLLTYAYLPRLAVVGAALAILTWIVLPLAEQKLPWLGSNGEIRLLWALMLVACAIRLIGVMYTTFGSQDLSINLGRTIKTITGQLVVIMGSHEFADGQIIYPPGSYLAILPGVTLTDDLASLMQGALALLEGTTAFLVAMLTRRLGGNRNAARFALVLYASNIAAFGTISYGFQQQIFGQWLTTPMALLLLMAETPPRPRTWLIATLLLLFGAFSHIGVAILGFGWFGWIALVMVFAYRGANRSWWWEVGLVLAAAVIAFGLLYVDVAGAMLNHASDKVLPMDEGTPLPGATGLLLKGLRLGYSDVGLALLPIGLLLIARKQPSLKHLLVPVSWLLTALFFLVIDLVLKVQVRYFFFALPLVLAAVGIALGYLSTRSRLARFVGWALVLALAFQSTALWFSVAFGDGKISITPLTH